MQSSLKAPSPCTNRVQQQRTSRPQQVWLPALRQISHPATHQPHNPCKPLTAGAARPAAHAAVCCAAAVDAASTSGRSGEEAADDDDDGRNFAIALARVADDTKALDICVLHVAPLVSWTSYKVIATVNSRPQLLAVLARMEEAAARDWQRSKMNTAGSSQWEVLDFGDVVAHIFTADQRQFYALDDHYALAEEVPLPFAPSSLEPPAAAVESGNRQQLGGQWAKNL